MNNKDNLWYNFPLISTKIMTDYLKIKSKLSCGENHTLLINDKNQIYAFGSNCYGQLGLGDYKDRNLLERAKLSERIIKMKCG